MKVIFFDIDGTLSNFEGVVPESAVRGVREARRKGNRTALCSGRSESQIEQHIVDIGFDAIVSAAGARVSVGGKAIYEATVPPEQYAACLEKIMADVPDLCVQTNDAVYVSEAGYGKLVEFTANVSKQADDPAEVVGNLIRVPSLAGIKGVQKMFYHMAPYTVDELQERLGDFFTVTELSFGESNPYCGEITMNGIEKATGMEQLMNYYGLTAADSVCFGDGPNDVDMMEYAGLAICMGNGWDEIKALADFVTADVDDDGIYKGLQHFGIVGE